MDTIRLEYEMKRRGITRDQLCENIKMSRSAFYRKTHNLSEFTQGEIQRICEFLELDSPMGIFFADKVS